MIRLTIAVEDILVKFSFQLGLHMNRELPIWRQNNKRKDNHAIWVACYRLDETPDFERVAVFEP